MPVCSWHLVADHLLPLGTKAFASACSMWQDCVSPLCPDLGSAPWAQVIWEHSPVGGATLNTCCLNARVSKARDGHWRPPFSGMSSRERFLDLIMQRRCGLQRFLLIVPLLWLPWRASSRSSSTLLLHWDVTSLGT